MTSLYTWAPEDGVLGAVAPLALASTQKTAVVIDLDPAGVRYGGSVTLADLVRDGPRRTDLQPDRTGVAVLPNGGVGPEEAHEVIHALMRGWPAVVLRLPSRAQPPRQRGVIAVRPLLPGLAPGSSPRPAVYQSAGWRSPIPGPGIVLPRPRPSTVHNLLAGRRPRPDRWLRAWRRVWELPWG